MTSYLRIWQKYKDARQRLSELVDHESYPQIVHYSCEDFHDCQSKASRRVTSIAVMGGFSGKSRSFSIQHEAEVKFRGKNFGLEDTVREYEELERSMLRNFFAYARNKSKAMWVHWEMRDETFGFIALEQRAKVVGARAYLVPDRQKVNLPDLLNDIYGKPFAESPKLQILAEMNRFAYRDLLSGEQEGEVFRNGDFYAVSQSALRKVRVISKIALLANERKLKTKAKFHHRPKRFLAAAGDMVFEHYVTKWVTLVLAIAGLFSLILSVVDFVAKGVSPRTPLV